LNCMECATFEYEMLLFLIYRCVVVEDSAIGLAAAKVAGMKCIVTKSGYISIY
jgi:beta-phosphoglucomutase-like phosphatase (HAD superfamily)